MERINSFNTPSENLEVYLFLYKTFDVNIIVMINEIRQNKTETDVVIQKL